MTSPALDVREKHCARCQSESRRACLLINGIAICLRQCLRPYLDKLEILDAKLWLKTQ